MSAQSHRTERLIGLANEFCHQWTRGAAEGPSTEVGLWYRRGASEGPSTDMGFVDLMLEQAYVTSTLWGESIYS